jgi:hypothetical protein
MEINGTSFISRCILFLFPNLFSSLLCYERQFYSFPLFCFVLEFIHLSLSIVLLEQDGMEWKPPLEHWAYTDFISRNKGSRKKSPSRYSNCCQTLLPWKIKSRLQVRMNGSGSISVASPCFLKLISPSISLTGLSIIFIGLLYH